MNEYDFHLKNKKEEGDSHVAREGFDVASVRSRRERPDAEQGDGEERERRSGHTGDALDGARGFSDGCLQHGGPVGGTDKTQS